MNLLLPQCPLCNKDMADHTMLVLDKLRFPCEQLEDMISSPHPTLSVLGKPGPREVRVPIQNGSLVQRTELDRGPETELETKGTQRRIEGKPRAMRRGVVGRGPAELRRVLITASKWVGQQG